MKKERSGWLGPLRMALTIAVGIGLLLAGNRLATGDVALFKGGGGVSGVPARVRAILSRETGVSPVSGVETYRIYFDAVVTGGEYKGLLIEGSQVEDPFAPLPMKEVEPGDKVLLYEMARNSDGSTQWVLQEYLRSDALVALALLFGGLLLLFGGRKGLFTIISLAFTCLAIFLVLVPAILSGYNIYLAAGAVCVFIILATLILVNGYNLKSLSAGAGCVGGLAVSGGLLAVSNLSLRLTGLLDEESAYLLYINPAQPMDLKAVVFCSIILGALGATLDVSVSIASSLSEIAGTGKPMGMAEVLRSGMNIGRDIMGTMANTLILAYIGGSMSLALLLIVYSNSLLELFNREMIVVEVLQSLVGSIGLLAAIPITAAVWGLTAGKAPERKKGKEEEEG